MTASAPSQVADARIDRLVDIIRWSIFGALFIWTGMILPGDVGGPHFYVVILTGIAAGVLGRRRWRPVLRFVWLAAVGLAIYYVATGEIAWWQAALELLAIGPFAALAGEGYFLCADFVAEEGGEGDTVWLFYLWGRTWLRRFVVAVCFVVGGAIWGWSGALWAIAPLVGVFLGRPVFALVAGAVTFVATGWSGQSWVGLALAVVYGLLSIPPNPPRRSLPVESVAWFDPRTPARQLRSCDRHLRRAEWHEALAALDGASSTDVRVLLRRAIARIEVGDAPEAITEAASAYRMSGPQQQALPLLVWARALLAVDDLTNASNALANAEVNAPPGSDLHARVTLAKAQVMLRQENYDAAVAHAKQAAGGFRGNGVFVERMTARRTAALAQLALDDLTAAEATVFAAQQATFATRWTRHYFHDRRNDKDGQVLFRRGAQMMAEPMRAMALSATISLDPRSHKRDGEDEQEAINDLDECALAFEYLGYPLDACEVEMQLATIYAAKGQTEQALESTLAVLAQYDTVRHALQTPTACALWSDRFLVALGDALHLATEQSDGALVAELIELARGETSPHLDGTPPTVRVRGRARIVRRQERESRPIDIETAAQSGGGPGAWWLSTWRANEWLYWSLIRPVGDVFHGRVPASAESELGLALAELEHAIPVRAQGETDADVDVRVGSGPMLDSERVEGELAARLGQLILPEALRRELLARRDGREPLPLVIAADPGLGHVPWAALAVADTAKAAIDRSELVHARLVELARIAIAPSASVLAGAARDGGVVDEPCPLAVVVLDPTDAPPDFPALTAASEAADQLPSTVRVLGGSHWGAEPATRDAVAAALTSVPRKSTAVFGCHAVTGIPGGAQTGALVLAASSGVAGVVEYLSADDVATLRGRSVPAQVSLQACDTSNLAAATHGEWLSLAPAMLGAGVRRVLVSVFPLIDTEMEPGEGSLLGALIRGENLTDAVRAAQLRGLTNWRNARPGLAELADTPLVWGALAVCAAGEVAVGEMTGTDALVSGRLMDMLEQAAGFAIGQGAGRVTTAHFTAEYIEMETELFDQTSFARGLTTAVGLQYLPRFLKGSSGVDLGPAVPALAADLAEALTTAKAVATTEGSRVHPEHVLAAIQATPSPGRRMLRLLRLHRAPTLRGESERALRRAQINDRGGSTTPTDTPESNWAVAVRDWLQPEQEPSVVAAAAPSW